MSNIIFTPSIETILLNGRSLTILRDDRIAGGTKRRGLAALLPSLPDKDIVYAGTIFGHGALALALACADAGKRAHLFLSSNDPSHPMVTKLRDAGACVEDCAPLPIDILYKRAAEWADRYGGYVFPPAFDTPAFHAAMATALSPMPLAPSEIWCVSVSGTLSRAIAAAFPTIPLRRVCVAGEAWEYTAPEKYHRPALEPPPWPSCIYTDAKAWRFVRDYAAPDALFWNTAG